MQTIGRDGLLRLARAWHRRVLEDEVVSHAFSHGYHLEHTERLAAYWAEALGGPTTYSDQYGDESSVVRIHSANEPHEEMDQQAIACFDQALRDVGRARDERLRCGLHVRNRYAGKASRRKGRKGTRTVSRGAQRGRESGAFLKGAQGGREPFSGSIESSGKQR
jgi:hemoglobin